MFIQSGFLAHNNDSAHFHMMPRIGPGEELHLPHELYILADKGYPEQYPLLTPWREAAIAGRQQRQLFNLELHRVRVRIEHCIRRMKEYGAVHHIWRHQRWMFPIVTELCACLAQRHILLPNTTRHPLNSDLLSMWLTFITRCVLYELICILFRILNTAQCNNCISNADIYIVRFFVFE